MKLRQKGAFFPLIPPGSYPAVILHVQEHENVIWQGRPDQNPRDVFRVIYGIWVGEPALIPSDWFTATFNENGKALPYLQALLGAVPDESFDTQQLVGKAVSLQVIQRAKSDTMGNTRMQNKIVSAVPADPNSVPPADLFAELWAATEPTLGMGPWLSPEQVAAQRGIAPPVGPPQMPPPPPQFQNIPGRPATPGWQQRPIGNGVQPAQAPQPAWNRSTVTQSAPKPPGPKGWPTSPPAAAAAAQPVNPVPTQPELPTDEDASDDVPF